MWDDRSRHAEAVAAFAEDVHDVRRTIDSRLEVVEGDPRPDLQLLTTG